MASKDFITQEYLKEILTYDPSTGIFIWKKRMNGFVAEGTIAGNKKDNGYVQLRIKKKSYLAHRLVFLYMIGSFPKNETDHINRIRNDNRWCNLRDVTHFENQHNKVNNNNYIGVLKEKYYGRHHAYIGNKYLGSFKTHIAACYCRHFNETIGLL